MVISILLLKYFFIEGIMKYFRNIFGYECDIYGHLNNANYLHIYEEARSEYLSKIGFSIKNFKALGYDLVLVHIELDFIKAVELNSKIEVQSEIISLNRLKTVWQQKIFNANSQLCNQAEVVGVYLKDKKPVRLAKNTFKALSRKKKN